MSADAWFAEAEGLLAERRLDEAMRCFEEAEAAGAGADRCAAGRWQACMLMGDFEAAWRESDAIRRRGAPDANRFWQGEELAGKRVMLRCLHGFGDATQFLRYAPRLSAIARSLTVEVPPRFVKLARCFAGVDDVISWGEHAPAEPPAFDVQMEVMELPYVFRTQLAELPIATNYLRLPCSAVKRYGLLKVGLAGNAGNWNPSRSIALTTLRPVLEEAGCEFWNLNECALDTEQMSEDPLCRASIEGLAARIAQLDLVITVDTLAAHLAGALGVRAWVLLQHQADWRWMNGREDSPWYPTVRLFRQPAPGDWTTPIDEVCAALQQLSRVEAGIR